MNRKRYKTGLVAALLAGLASAALAQQPAKASASDIDPDAISALDRMGAYLRTVKTFRVTAKTTRDRVLDNGQLVQSDVKADILAQLPSRLRVDSSSSRQDRMFLYDGKSFVIYGKRVQYYATVPAPGTVGELAGVLADKYDIELPLQDLFWWGTERVNSSAILSATDIGPSDVQGTTCEQYAFRQAGADWQIWIQLGEYPLPRKLVITTTTDESRPQYSAVYTWDLAPSFDEAAFTFVPPAGAHKIPLAPARAGK